MRSISNLLTVTKRNHRITAIVVVGLLLIACRFLVFSDFVSVSEDNARFYLAFASANALVPLLAMGIPFAQSSLYPKLALTNHIEATYIKRLGAVLGVGVGILSLVLWFVTYNPSTVAVCQFAVNYLYQSARSDDQGNSVFLIITEVFFLNILWFFIDPTLSFKILFLYYSLFLILYGCYRILRFRISSVFVPLQYFLSCFLVMLRQAPMIAKEYFDVILVGFFASPEISASYAVVILCTAPLKVLFSNIIIFMNLVLAKYQKYYSNLIDRDLGLASLFACLFSVLGVGAVCILYFNRVDVLFAVLIRALGLILGLYLNMRLIDEIQKRSNFDARTALLIFALLFLSAYLVVSEFSILEVYAAVPLVVLAAYTALSRFAISRL